ncbi:MAG: rRNA pseudouridine synthase [Candidatus Hydrogenedentes bacterium]|nr:rRNA pseudouridine synthase [Candidatus Hydrogenedentota bacterium]
MRLQQFIASCGIASRRAAEQLIAEQRVTVNGRIAKVGDQIDPGTDQVALDGQAIQRDAKAYILLNKPKGVVTSARDTHGRGTVLDCLEGLSIRVVPVGRLDLDTEGALLLTNDGDLAFRLTHPRYEVKKVYLVHVRGVVTGATVRQLQGGVPLEDGMTAACGVRVLGHDQRSTRLELTLHEGRKREIKRMCEYVGHRVLALRRASFAGLKTGRLKPGEWRHLTQQEVKELRKLVRIGLA